MAFHYRDVAGKEKDPSYIIPGYELGYDISIELVRQYPSYNRIGIADAALRLGYYMGVEAEKHETAGNKAPV